MKIPAFVFRLSALLLAVTAVLTACRTQTLPAEPTVEPTATVEATSEPTAVPTAEPTMKGVLILTMQEQETVSDTLTLIADGESDYRIVYPFSSHYEEIAANTLASVIEIVTGVKLSVVADVYTEKNAAGAKEILVGNTCRAADKELDEATDELTYAFRVSGDDLLLFGKSPKITQFAVEQFLKECLGYQSSVQYTSCETLVLDTALTHDGSYLETLRNGKISEYSSPAGQNASYNRPTEDVTPAADSNCGETAATGLTETGTVTVDKSDIYTGGGQFIAKLYTEGLSRAPSGAEFAAAEACIAAGGCTVPTLTDMAKAVFGGTEFAALGLTERETLFAVTRAILNRDPTNAELTAFDGKDAAALAEKLLATAEFAALLPDIIAGPYYWTGNNAESYTSGSVMTAAELQALLKADTTVALPQGTLVLLDREISLPDGCILTTEGEPTHYTQMARLMRKPGADCFHLVNMNYDCQLRAVYVEGNFSSFDNHSYKNGINVLISANGCTVTGCRISDSVSHGTLLVSMSTEHHVLSHNLITGYANHHSYTWADGISCLGTDTLIEYNDLVDMTDGVVAVFRYINLNSTAGYIRAQNTITRYNTFLNAGNAAYVAYDHETVNYSTEGPDYLFENAINEDPANMTGCIAYENAFYTARNCHVHMVATLSTMPWRTEAGCDRAFGGSFVNNYTPAGCYCCCGAGIVADKATDITVRGNQLRLYVGDWHTDNTAASPYSVHETDTAGDLQPGWRNETVSCFISSALPIETQKRYTLTAYLLWDEPVTVPVSLFGKDNR